MIVVAKGTPISATISRYLMFNDRLKISTAKEMDREKAERYIKTLNAEVISIQKARGRIRAYKHLALKDFTFPLPF